MKPKVILGDFTGRREPRLQELGWGRMKIDRNFTPKGKHQGRWMHYAGEPWALDNGAFIQWRAQGFSSSASYDYSSFDGKLRELEDLAYVHPDRFPLFIVAPDLPAQGLASLAHSLEWIHERVWNWEDELYGLRSLWDFYLAVQDGMDPADLRMNCQFCDEPIHTHFQGIFLGGTDSFKKEAALAWSANAKALGLKFHYARAGTLEKMRHAHQVGADSLDSAFPMFLSSRWSAFEDAWLELDNPQPEKPHGQLHLWN